MFSAATGHDRTEDLPRRVVGQSRSGRRVLEAYRKFKTPFFSMRKGITGSRSDQFAWYLVKTSRSGDFIGLCGDPS